ncbi:MAG: tetratricopeptide repeat protein [Verrucomicrobia bacterium]|nr:tetratricopeptide repeat protein [Verrucomicrobiota bacterium]
MNPTLKPVLFAVLLALAVGLVYSNALDGPFVLDDKFSIVDNPALRTLWPLTAALNPPPVDVTFCTRPIINLTMCVDYALWGLNPRGYHLAGIAFHLAATLVLFGLLSRIFQRMNLSPPEALKWSFLAALLWALHPLATAAVNYPSQRGELGVGLFLFLTLYFLDRAGGPRLAGRLSFTSSDQIMEDERSREPKFKERTWPWLLVSVLACLLGMGSKENMIVAPVLAMVYDRVFLSASWKTVFRQRGLFYLALAATALWPIHRHMIFSPHVRSQALDAEIWWRYLPTQSWGLNRFIRLIVWPHPLVFDYGRPLAGGWGEVWMPTLGLLLLIAATGWALLKHPRWGFMGLCFFALLAPASLFLIPGQPLAEHRMYVPLAFAVVLLVMGARQLLKNMEISAIVAPAAFALVALVFGGLTWHRNQQYRSEVTLLSDTITKWPYSARAYSNRGLARQEQGDRAGALADYDRALELSPDYFSTLLNRANILFDLGEYEAALEDLDRAQALQPESPLLPSLRTLVLERMGGVQAEH